MEFILEKFKLFSKDWVLCFGRRDGEKFGGFRSVEIVWNSGYELYNMEEI